MKNARRTNSQSLGLFLMRHMNRDFSVPQKLLDFEAGMKPCKEQPILDKLSRAGRCDQASEGDVTVEY
eukprot:scaffold33601_cov155-Skeletonema_dohrnii-CCMP3373.AAC.4